MNRLADYLHAAERDNTRRSYASAIRHFEVEWKGLLPATGDAVAHYLSDHAETLSTIITSNRPIAARCLPIVIKLRMLIDVLF